jgi:hypothetical protein
MLHEKEKRCIEDVLESMPAEGVHMLARTVTNNLIITTSLEGR